VAISAWREDKTERTSASVVILPSTQAIGSTKPCPPAAALEEVTGLLEPVSGLSMFMEPSRLKEERELIFWGEKKTNEWFQEKKTPVILVKYTRLIHPRLGCWLLKKHSMSEKI